MPENAPEENFDKNDLPKDNREAVDNEKVSPDETQKQLDQIRDREKREESETQETAEREFTQGLEDTENEDPIDKMTRLVRMENGFLKNHPHTFNRDETGNLIVNVDIPANAEECDGEWRECLGFYTPDKHGKLHPVDNPGLYIATDDELLDHTALA